MSLVGDERAQSIQIGAVLLFAVLIIAFSTYQAFIIPNQNKQIEFNHLDTVQNEMTTLRDNLLNAKRNGETRSASITLGTQYPPRLIARNPPSPSGSLRTANPGTVELSYSDASAPSAATLCSGDNSNTITSRSLVYSPNYNELQGVESVSYENTFVTRSFSRGRVSGSQDLVQTNDAGEVTGIDIVPLTGEYDTTGTDRVSLDFNASGTNETTVSTDTVTLTVPSRFSADYWENTVLDGVAVTATDNTDISGEDRVDLEFTTPGSVAVRCTAIGADSNPTTDPEAGESDEDSINPVGSGEVRYDSANVVDAGAGQIQLTFTNRAGTDTNISQARINFYNIDRQSQGNQRTVPGEAVMSPTSGSPTATLTVGGPFVDVSSLDITIPADNSQTFELDFDQSIDSDDWFIISLTYDNGNNGQYFINVP